MGGKRDWTLVKETPSTLPISFATTRRSMKISLSNRSFSEYRRARSRNITRSQSTPLLPQISQALNAPFSNGDSKNSLVDVIMEEENKKSIGGRFALTEEYVRKEGAPTRKNEWSNSSSKYVSKMFKKKVSDLNKEIVRLEAENSKLRTDRHETGKIIAEQREQLDILLSKQECLKKDLHKTIVELEEEMKLTQTIKKDRDTLQQQLDVHVQKELTQCQNSECTFSCNTCDSKIFTRSLIVSKVRSLNEGTSYIVKSLECEFTLGPRAIRNIPSLSKLFRVRSLYCDGCLKLLGYKFSSAQQIFDGNPKEVGDRYFIEAKHVLLVKNTSNKRQHNLEGDILKTF